MAARKTKPAEREEVVQTSGHRIAISADDITLPRMRIAQDLSDSVKSGRNKVGDILIGFSAEDAEAEVVYEAAAGGEGVKFFVLDMNTHLSVNEGGELRRYQLDDPEAPQNARTAYEYVLSVPAFDAELPVIYTFSPSASRVAGSINAAIARHQQHGPPWELQFEMTTAMRQRDRHSWAAPVVRAIEVDQSALAVATTMGERVTARPQRQLDPVSDQGI